MGHVTLTTYDLPHYQPPYLHNLISVQCPSSIRSSPSLVLLGHLHHALLKSIIAHFNMLHRVSGINSHYLFANLILVPVPPVPNHPLLHLYLLPLLFHHSAHPQLPLSFTLGLKPVPVVPLLPPGLPSRTFARTVSSELIDFCF